MSGHSKWATIKHKKGAADKKRGKLFAKLIKPAEAAARQGGGDVDANPTLRTMYQKARDASVPLDTIERAIKRGTGELEGIAYEAVTYEGYAPHGVALYVETLTDNRNRPGAEIRALLTKNGGSLAEPGSVAWQFERAGVIMLPGQVDEDTIMEIALDTGADALEAADVPFETADVTMLATSSVAVEGATEARAVLRLIDLIDDQEDVQDVYSNFDIPDEVLESLGAV